MDLLERILKCEDNEVETIMDEAIKNANENATNVEQLGLTTGSWNTKLYPPFKGFIPLNTRIKYSSISLETYGMQTTDFFYDFARFIRKNKIGKKFSLVNCLTTFLFSYFGYPNQGDREYIFQVKATEGTTTDEEYFQALENNKIGDLKGMGAAECTEFGAVAQQLLNLFSIDTYYCMGCMDADGRQEGHCFNIAKTTNGYMLIDTAASVETYNQNQKMRLRYPFLAELTNEEFQEFINNGIVKTFDDYDYDFENGKLEKVVNGSRSYVVGSYAIEKEDLPNRTVA